MLEMYHGKPYHDLGLLAFQNRFPTEDSCWEYFLEMRWSDGCKCPKGCAVRMYSVKKGHVTVFECKKCRTQTYLTAGTMFEKSRQPLRKWFWAIFLMATSKKGVSMIYLQQQLGIKSYQTAWLMGHKIRHAMQKRDSAYKLKGTVEADEIIIGGKQSKENRKMLGSNKSVFFMGVEENEKERPRFVTFEELREIYDQQIVHAVEKHVKKGSTVKSDGSGAYQKLNKRGYENKQSIYRKNPEQTIAHLKWVNMLTSNLKRFLLSTYHGVFPKYRDAYLAEFAYRFNRRYWPEQAFDRLLYACIKCKPVTLPALTS
jgi:ISXO2-like transposase domain/Transposase zinc-ribbon domain